MTGDFDLRPSVGAVNRLIETLGWQQFHRPRFLVQALATEVAELLDRTLYKEPQEVDALFDGHAMLVQDEIADVLINLISLLRTSEIDLNLVVSDKINELLLRHNLTPFGQSRSDPQLCSQCGLKVESEWQYCPRCAKESSQATAKNQSPDNGVPQAINSDISGWDRLASTPKASLPRNSWVHEHSLFPSIIKAIPSHTRRILEFGAGRGELVSVLRARAGWEVTGYDPSPGMRQAAADAGVQLEATTSEFPDGSFDCVTANMVASATADLRTMLVEIRRLLGQGGVAILTVPHPCFSLLRNLHTTTKRESQTEPSMAFVVPRELEWMSAYRDGSKEILDWGNSGVTTSLYNRSLTAYMEEMQVAGLRLEDLIEVYPASGGAEDPRLHSLHSVVPGFVTMILCPTDDRAKVDR